ncbi:MAG: hypothetical protein IJT97_00130 [Bacteroidaceae bacterium]|nr:hypothetical protein [Bacteroidaceae bacterium]
MRKTDDYFSPSDYRATLGLWTLASASQASKLERCCALDPNQKFDSATFIHAGSIFLMASIT